MSERSRGQEKSVRFLIENQQVVGSWTKVMDLEITPQTDLPKTDFLGEKKSDIDIQHNGFDGSFTLQHLDAQLIAFLDEIDRREEAGEPPQSVQVQVRYSFRSPTVKKRIVTYFNGHMKVASESDRDRKAYSETKFEFSYQSRRTVVLG
jgi:hypothetical protein